MRRTLWIFKRKALYLVHSLAFRVAGALYKVQYGALRLIMEIDEEYFGGPDEDFVPPFEERSTTIPIR
jgi:hypothetical protein